MYCVHCVAVVGVHFLVVLPDRCCFFDRFLVSIGACLRKEEERAWVCWTMRVRLANAPSVLMLDVVLTFPPRMPLMLFAVDSTRLPRNGRVRVGLRVWRHLHSVHRLARRFDWCTATQQTEFFRDVKEEEEGNNGVVRTAGM